MISEIIEKYFHSFLQCRVTFEIGDKTIKRGKLILISVKDFHIFFTLQTDNNDMKQFIIPLPYSIDVIGTECICLDFSIERLCQGEKSLLYKLKTASRKKNTRFYDTKMYCCKSQL